MKAKTTYIGAGVGLMLFATFGLLPGSFLGGVMGLNLAGVIFGMPVTSSVVARMMVGASMAAGVMVSGLIFVTTASTLGWVFGAVLDRSKTVKTTVNISVV